MKPRRLPQLWTVSQRRVIILLIAILTIGLSIQLWRRPISIAYPPPTDSPRGDEIADRLDPNTADAAALAAIPNLGEKRAQDIVAYRNTFTVQHPGDTAFTRPEDLMRIKGIGAGTVANVRPFLTFAKSRTDHGK
jgi:hypothetical protein